MEGEDIAAKRVVEPGTKPMLSEPCSAPIQTGKIKKNSTSTQEMPETMAGVLKLCVQKEPMPKVLLQDSVGKEDMISDSTDYT